MTHPKEAEEPTPPLRAGGGDDDGGGVVRRRRSARRPRSCCTPDPTRVHAGHARPIYGRVQHGTPESGAADGHWEGDGLALPTPAGVSGLTLAGQHATPPLRHEGMRVREGVRQRQTAPLASDATQSGCLRNDTRRVPACPRDVGAGEHPRLATDCSHTRALALGARAGKIFRLRSAKWADRIAGTCHATAPGE